MPFLHLRTDQATDLPALRRALAAILYEMLDKPPARCMIQMETCTSIAMGDGETGCAFLDIRVRGIPGRVDACADRLRSTLAEQLCIPPERVYLHFQLITETGIEGGIR